MARLKKALKLSAWAVTGFVLALIVLLAITKIYLDAVCLDGYDPAMPLEIREVKSFEEPAGQYTQFYYRGFRGEETPALLALPKSGKAPFPCIVFLHGFLDDKGYMFRSKLDRPFLKAGFALACFDQLMQGDRKIPAGTPVLEQGNTVRLRPAYAINDARRMIDYLQTREDIDSDRLYLCGFSFGAVTGTTVTALDPRIRAAVLLYGGGNLVHLPESETIAKELGPWRLPAQAFIWYFWSAIDPVRYVGRISPRPVLFLNGKADSAMSPACARALHNAASEPMTVRWYEGEHLGLPCDIDMKAIESRVLNDAIEFLKAQEAGKVSGETQPSSGDLSEPGLPKAE